MSYDPCDGCGDEIDDPDCADQIEGVRLCSKCLKGWLTWDDALERGDIGPRDHPAITVQ